MAKDSAAPAPTKERAAPTTADYVVSALSPALIIGLVASLVFFLVEVVYVGDFKGRMYWTFFFFSVGAVLTARVAIEVDKTRANLYAAVLGLVTLLALFRFVDITGPLANFSWLINLALIGVVLWSAHKLTWDCTFIDERRDASDQSVLEASGLQEPDATDDEEPATVEVVADGPRKRKPKPVGFWQRWQQYRAVQAKKPHTPGVWVVYFSLAALPLFGLGQALIPATDTARRAQTFWLLVIYVGCGLGLLLTTCFLGLRRYLRQRDVPMPAKLTAVWMGLGGGLIVLFLTIAAILPRPQSETPIASFSVGSKKREASKAAPGGSDKAQGQGRAGDQKSKDGQGDKTAGGKDAPQGQQGQGGKGGQGQQGQNGRGDQSQSNGGKQPNQGQQGGQNDQAQRSPGDQKNQSKSNEQPQGKNENQPNNGDNQQGGQNDQSDQRDQDKDDKGNDSGNSSGDRSSSDNPADKPAPKSWEMPTWLEKVGTVLKWLVFAILAIAVIVFLLRGGLRYLANFSQWARDLLAAIRAFFDRLFGRKSAAAAEPADNGPTEPDAPRPRLFSGFSNPFDSATRRPTAELVRYSFAALEAWAHEHDLGRRGDETPIEFAGRLNRELPALGPDAQRLANLYARLAYAQKLGLPANSPAVLQQFWLTLEAVAGDVRAAATTLQGAEVAE